MPDIFLPTLFFKMPLTLKFKNYPISAVLLLFVLLATMLGSCSTKKNTATRRAFHNLTAHYNTYWNGREAFRQGVRELNNQIQPNYTQILPVENYGTLQQAQGINSHMDRAIEKGSKVIQKHTMYFERKERVKRVPDSYMLIGKAYFYKQDYYNARQTFEFVAQRYEREPIRFHALIWQARTAVMLREYERSGAILDNLQSQVRRHDFPKELRSEMPIVFALHYTAQENYAEAKPQLRRAAENNKDKNISARMYFILAQILHREEAYAEATRYYARVVKMNPSYDMRFNAQISMAQCFDARSGNSREMVATLNKLLRSTRNVEFHDQIYYALAHVALRESNDTAAIRYLRQSVASSVSNDYQKALSSRKLADIYFEIPHFQNASAYYDTTMQVLQFDHADYAMLDRRNRVLSDLVTNLNIILQQDSLQRVAAMSEDERNKIIDGIIAQVKEEQEQERLEEERLAMTERTAMPMPGRDPRRSMMGGMQQDGVGVGNWYFDNPQTVSYGFSEFTRKWGRRKLEDNWRLSDRRSYDFQLAEGLDPEADTTDSKEGGRADDPLKRETYLKNLPRTPEQLEASNRLIASAQYNVGYVFRDGLRDHPRSIEAFDKFVTRFPEDTRELDALYHLYTLNVIEKNPAEADIYKQMIIRKYPDSHYTTILTDPDYFARVEEENRRISLLYEDTYRAFQNRQFRMVVIYSNEAEATYPDSPLLPRFAYLRAKSIGGMHNQDTLVNQMKRFIAAYPSSELVARAQDVLATFGIEGFEDEDDETMLAVKQAPSLYSVSHDKNHFFVIIVDHNKADVDAIRVRLSDFNTQNYRMAGLVINAVLLDTDRQMISVSNFRGRDPAMAYYGAITKDDYVFSQQLRRNSQHFVISADNYPIFYNDKVVDTYQKFFQEHYLKK